MCFLMSENKMHSSISNEKVITYMAKIKARECQNVEYKSSWHDEKGILIREGNTSAGHWVLIK